MTIETIERDFKAKVCEKIRLSVEGVRTVPRLYAVSLRRR